MTLAEFADVFAGLAVQLRQMDADEMTIRLYFDVLKDIEIDFLKAAARRLALKATWFPKTSEWRDEAIRVETERTFELRDRLSKRTEPLCAKCGDTQWELNAHTNRVSRCECAKLRRLEVLGRRPMPAQIEAVTKVVSIDAEAIAKSLAAPMGIH